MTEILGTNVAAKIAPFTTEDEYATHVSTYGQGGWREVATINDRNNIPTARRMSGMAVYVNSESKVYILDNDLTTWTEFETGKIDTIQKNGTDLPITNKTVNIEVPDVIDNLTSTSTTDALSANQGKVLYDAVESVSGRGRYLTLWNCATGLAETNPPSSPYEYKNGDYFIVGTVASSGGINYRPTGSSYTTGSASQVVETEAVDVNDTYIYDGTNWHLQMNTQKEVSFSSVAGSPYDNSNLADALNAKVNKTNSASKVYGTDNQGNQTTYDVNSFGAVDDVRVNDVSVVTNKIANVTVPTDNSELTNGAGYITGINSSDVTTALGYTPYNSTNPNGYQTAGEVETAISTHNMDAEAHADIRAEIQALNEFTADTIVPTTTNFVPTTTYTVDEALQRTANLFGGVQGEINDINSLIPNQATTSNKLADKAFVNSTVATNAANFRGNWATWSDVPSVATDYPEDYTGSKTPTNNDYMTVTDASGYNVSNTGSWRFIYVGDWSTNGKSGWNPQYRIGTAFTAAQQAAIDSGITATMVDNYVNPTSNANTAYNKRITALETDKVDKIYSANKIYGTDSTGAQIGYQAGSNLELRNGLINVIGVQQQIFVMPEATEALLGSIVQYMGETNQTYTHGVMYQCVPVYGNYTATYSGTGTLSDLQLDSAVFIRSSEFVEGQTRYVFTCMRSGLRQQWQAPSGRNTNFLAEYGITYSGRAAVNDTITITASIVGYTWEAYAGVSSGNDKIDIVGDKVYGVNVVPQYTRNTLPAAIESNAGMICQYKGTGTLLDIYQDGYFYQVSEDISRRSFELQAEPNKYSSLYIDNYFALEDFMQYELDDVTFYYVTAAQSMTMQNGWLIRGSMLENPTNDLTGYGISYTVADGQTLTDGDEITVHILKSYYWKNIQVQSEDFIVDILPNADEDNLGRVVFLAGSDMLEPLPEYPVGKWYRCEQIYDEDIEDWTYDWAILPNQISLPMVTALETNASKVITGQCFDYVGDDSTEYSNDLQRIVLRKGHIYRAVVKYPDDEDFATVCYYDVYPYQFDGMPTAEEEYNEVFAQYTGTGDGTYVQGHFYRCVPTGEMTPPSSMSKPSEEGFSFEIDADVLATQVQDPSEAFTFEFQSQGPGFQWLVRTGPNRWTTCELSWYGITVVGEAPYGAQVKVKYIEPQPEYVWHEISISGDNIQYEEMPEISEDDVGRIVQYIGETTEEFINGYFYQAVTEMVPSSLNYYTSSSAFTVTLDKDQFESYVEPTGEMDLVFIYNTGSSTWLLQGGDLPVAVDIADYGVTVTGTPNNNDRLELFYYPEYPDYWWEEKDVQNNSQTGYLNDVTPLDVGKIRQYTDETDQNYTNGYFYKAHIGLNQTSGTMLNPLSIVDEKLFANQVYATEMSSGEKVKGIRFEVRETFMTQWLLYFFDENGNEIGLTTTNPNLAEFEQTFGLSIGGTVTTSTTAEGNIFFNWEKMNVQPLPSASEFPNYDSTKKQMLVHSINSDVISWEDIS